ncbi:hypothetical protein NDU88_009837 [Pleurodeles waltl]|uniref:Uncharacterized protein n=1 Tax=Pleurodeles waltl TaxID=8319 RepID=A0AAV7PW95_PLEWA|nr:hypothetical protein NDU88_009837 [Pleurodeles waltl]
MSGTTPSQTSLEDALVLGLVALLPGSASITDSLHPFKEQHGATVIRLLSRHIRIAQPEGPHFGQYG